MRQRVGSKSLRGKFDTAQDIAAAAHWGSSSEKLVLILDQRWQLPGWACRPV